MTQADNSPHAHDTSELQGGARASTVAAGSELSTTASMTKATATAAGVHVPSSGSSQSPSFQAPDKELARLNTTTDANIHMSSSNPVGSSGNAQPTSPSFRRPSSSGAKSASTLKGALVGLLLALLWYGVLVMAVGDVALPPHGVLFSLLLLFVLAHLAGRVAQALSLPPLLGMMLVGMILGNVPGIDIARGISEDIFAPIRTMALATILTRAGVGLDVAKIRELAGPAFSLALLPCSVEATTCMFIARGFFGMPWSWALMMGFVVAAVSPAVVLPSIIGLQEQGYGKESGITSLLVAAAALDDVYAIAAFNICFALSFADGGLTWKILHAPVEIVIGVAAGIALGFLCLLAVPPSSAQDGEPSDPRPTVSMQKSESSHSLLQTEQHAHNRAESGRAHPRFLRQLYRWWIMAPIPVGLCGTSPGSAGVVRLGLLYGGALCCVMGGKQLHFAGGGALAAIIGGAIAGTLWGAAPSHSSGDGGLAWVKAQLALIWSLFGQPLLFALIGAKVDLRGIEGDIVGKGVGLLLMGLCARSGAVLLAVSFWKKANLKWKERLFVMLAWLPKATVQAALGAVPLGEALAIWDEGAGRGADTSDSDFSDDVVDTGLDDRRRSLSSYDERALLDASVLEGSEHFVYKAVTSMGKDIVQEGMRHLLSLPNPETDLAQRNDECLSDECRYGEQILTVAVIAILLTAPPGAVIINYFGPRFLSKADSQAASNV